MVRDLAGAYIGPGWAVALVMQPENAPLHTPRGRTYYRGGGGTHVQMRTCVLMGMKKSVFGVGLVSVSF